MEEKIAIPITAPTETVVPTTVDELKDVIKEAEEPKEEPKKTDHTTDEDPQADHAHYKDWQLLGKQEYNWMFGNSQLDPFFASGVRALGFNMSDLSYDNLNKLEEIVKIVIDKKGTSRREITNELGHILRTIPHRGSPIESVLFELQEQRRKALKGGDRK